MATHDADLEYGPTPPDAEYEHTDIEPGIAGRFAVWLAIAMVVSGALVYGTFWLFEGRALTGFQQAQQFPLAAGRPKEPPPPRLQTQPFKDGYQLQSSQLQKLQSYGWVDQGSGVVHIPIDEAMRLAIERDTIPAAAAPSAGLNQVTQDSSSGRTTAPRY
jgi:hypothetical protein